MVVIVFRIPLLVNVTCNLREITVSDGCGNLRCLSDNSKVNLILLLLKIYRSKFAKPSESGLWKDVTQEIMSDEEDTEEGLQAKSLAPSRSKEINNLIEALDQRKNAHDRDNGLAPPRKIRVVSKFTVKR